MNIDNTIFNIKNQEQEVFFAYDIIECKNSRDFESHTVQKNAKVLIE